MGAVIGVLLLTLALVLALWMVYEVVKLFTGNGRPPGPTDGPGPNPSSRA